MIIANIEGNMIILKAVLINNLELEYITIQTNKDNYKLHLKKLEAEKYKIIERLREYKKAGIIKSIFKPRNKKMQKHLNELVFAKKILNDSSTKIKRYFN
jgi:hypothetical protein